MANQTLKLVKCAHKGCSNRQMDWRCEKHSIQYYAHLFGHALRPIQSGRKPVYNLDKEENRYYDR